MKISVPLVLAFLLFSNIKQAPAQNLDWAFAVSTTNFCSGHAIKSDVQGNIYIAGHFDGYGDFDPGPVTQYLSISAQPGIFVAKYTSTGALIWAHKLAAITEPIPYYYAPDLILDQFGDIYITGTFTGEVDFDPSSAEHKIKANGGGDGFVLKLDSNGNFKWVNSFGGSSYDYATTLVLQDSNVIVAGVFWDSALFTSATDTTAVSLNQFKTAFIAAYGLDGVENWIKPFIGNYTMNVDDMKVDVSNSIVMSGSFSNQVDFDLGSGTFNMTSFGATSGFILKTQSNGNFIWAKRIGGLQETYAHSLEVSSFGNIIVSGRFTGTADFDTGSLQYNLTSLGDNDCFLACYNSLGNLIYAKQFGGLNTVATIASAIDIDDYVYVGVFFEDSLSLVNSIPSLVVSQGGYDILVSKLDGSGSTIWTHQIGGLGQEIINDIDVAANGAIIFTGHFNSTSLNFDLSGGSTTISSSSSNRSLFIVKYNQQDFGTGSISHDQQLTFYPNPTQNLLQVEVLNEKFTYLLLDLNGQTVQKGQLEQTVDMTNLPSGVYVLQTISMDGFLNYQKIIKQ